MHRLPFEQQLLVLVQTAALIGLIIRLWREGLHRVYVFFFGYLLASFLQTCVPLAVPVDSLVYRDLWLATEGLIVSLYVLVVLELYTIVLQDVVGIASLSRRYIQVALATGILASILLVGVEKTGTGLVTHFFLTFERAVVLSLVFFIFLLTAFLVYYPIPLKRNVIIYSIGYAVYFLAKATELFVLNLGYYWNRQLSNVGLTACLACFVFWLFALNRRGETKTVILGHRWNTQDEDRLMAQLRAINASLVRTAPK